MKNIPKTVTKVFGVLFDLYGYLLQKKILGILKNVNKADRTCQAFPTNFLFRTRVITWINS